MSPESERFWAKALECLEFADANLAAGLSNDAGRNAYLAVFHAAKAIIFERTGKIAKTHRGVHAEFNRVALREPDIGGEFRSVLSQTYNLKAVADYETGPDSVIPRERAAAAIQSARKFAACISQVLSDESNGSTDST